MWSHAAAAAIALFAYISTLSLNRVWSGTTLILIGSPVLLPYVASATYCWQLYTWRGSGPGLLRVAGFVVLLMTGAALVDLAILGALGPIDLFSLVPILALQAGCYLGGANVILEVI